MKLFDQDTSWDASRKDVLHTRATVLASAEHARLARPCESLLNRWNVLETERRSAEDGVVAANAVVAWVDTALDTWVKKFAARVFAHQEGSYGKYFDAPPSEIIRLGLESELPEVKRFHRIAEETHAPREVRELLPALAELEHRGKTALDARVRAVEEAARVSLKIQSWKEDANAARRSIETALDDYANRNQLPRDYSAVFFLKVSAPRKKSGKKQAGATAAAATTGA